MAGLGLLSSPQKYFRRLLCKNRGLCTYASQFRMPKIAPFLVPIFSFLILLRLTLSTVEWIYSWKHAATPDPYRGLEIRPEDRSHNLSISSSHNTSETLALQPRVFKSWPSGTPLPCYPAEPSWQTGTIQKSPTSVGFLYLKPFKTASSTLAGVNARIARNVGQRTGTFMCRARFSHGPQPYPAESLFSHRDPSKSFLWTVLREPNARAVSQFFHFSVSKRGVLATDEEFRRFLFQKDYHAISDYYLQCLHPFKKFNRNDFDPMESAQEILNEYDFIGITERLDESLVVLMLLLDLPMSDILYISAKAGGSYDPYDKGGNCTLILPNFTSKGMKRDLESDEWNEVIRYDRALYEAARQSLDLTIDSLGRKRVSEHLHHFLQAKQGIARQCEGKVITPCDKNGQPIPQNKTDCLFKDSGCGTGCIDQVATDLSLWEKM